MNFKFEFGDLFKIPNILCYIRILLVPLFLYIFFTATEPKDYYIATSVVMISGATAFLDGQIARKFNMVTDLGKLIDPIADKLMQLAMVVALTYKISYMYILVILFVLKECVTSVVGFIVLKTVKRRLNGAKWYGKVCTAVLYAVMLILVAFPYVDLVFQRCLLIICAAVLIMAFIMYVRLYIIMVLDAVKERNDKVLY